MLFNANCTLDELIEALQEVRDEVGGDAEVRMVTQHNWPLEYTVFGVSTGAQINADEDSLDDGDVSDDNVVYLVEGTQLGYGSKRAWGAC
jgi:hypothetical protein